MTTRRKKLAPSEDEGTDVPAEDKPKKKRAPRKKADAPVAVAPPVDDADLTRPASSSAVNIPIQPAEPPVPPTMKQDRVMPVGMRIESVSPIPVDEDQGDDTWRPPRKADSDLRVPPPVLMQRKQAPVVDILDVPDASETDEDDGIVAPHAFAQPAVRTGMYRKIGIGFAVLAFLAILGVGYVVFAKANVMVHPRKVEVSTERVLTVTETASAESQEEVPGEVREITVAGEKTEAVRTADGSAAPAEQLVDAIATGSVTIYNETSSPVTLIPTTRLLTPESILFRIRERVNIPAGGSVAAEVYADKAGASGNIGPSNFIVPGLPVDLQDDVYARSTTAMTGGVKTASGGTATAASGAVVTQDQIDALEKSLREELTEQAKGQLEAEITGVWSGEEYLAETMNRFVSTAAGQTADAVVIRLTIRVRYVGFDKARAVALAADDLKRGLTSDRELQGIEGDAATATVESADPEEQTASIRVSILGYSTISLESSLFDASRLKGLNMEGVRTYFDGIEGVDRVDVRFSPFFIKRMPMMPDNITFEIVQE